MTGIIPYFRPVLVLVTRLEAFTHVPMEEGEGEPIGTDVNKTAVASAVRCGACTTTTTSVKRGRASGDVTAVRGKGTVENGDAVKV